MPRAVPRSLLSWTLAAACAAPPPPAVAPPQAEVTPPVVATTPEPLPLRGRLTELRVAWRGAPGAPADTLRTPEEALAHAQTLRDRLTAGASMTELARAHSDAPSAARGGDLGWVTPDHLPPSLRATLAAAGPEQVALARTEAGWHLLRLEPATLPRVRWAAWGHAGARRSRSQRPAEEAARLAAKAERSTASWPPPGADAHGSDAGLVLAPSSWAPALQAAAEGLAPLGRRVVSTAQGVVLVERLPDLPWAATGRAPPAPPAGGSP